MITRLEVEATQPSPAAGAGPDYEILNGRAYGELDPGAACNAIITDLAFAPVNQRGKVEYSVSFFIAKPVDMSLASGVALYDVPNRGMAWPGSDPDGHIRIVSGWQGDIPPTPGFQTATVPTARAADGASLTGPVLVRLADMPRGVLTIPLADGLGVPVPRPMPVSLDTGRAQLLRLEADDRPPVALSAQDWSFGDCASTAFPGEPDPGKVSLRGGFDPDYTYVLVYEAKDPKVLGIGFAATRDLNAFLRHEALDSTGAPNPLAGSIQWSIAAGVSQAGNFLRSFLHLGFNADEEGRKVFDGMNVQIAARQVPLNVRFGLPGGAASLYEIGSEGALWWSRYHDKARGRGTTSLLDRCIASNTCPRIIETFGAAEIWGLRMSPDLIGTDASADIALPANVRRYYFPGVTHYGSLVGGFSTVGDESFPGMPKSVMAGNPNPTAETLRSVARMLVGWVKDDKEPPASCYPTLATGDLVEPNAAAMGWPKIPGSPTPDGKINAFIEYDLGEGFGYDDLSGVIANQPPTVGRTFPSRVSRVNADGNEVAGIPSVQHLVPLGTYTGWNERAEGYGKGKGSGFFGGFIPFARTRAERLAAGDPRLSLEEHYGDHVGFVARVRKVATERAEAGWLLPDDAAKLIGQAEASSVLTG